MPHILADGGPSAGSEGTIEPCNAAGVDSMANTILRLEKAQLESWKFSESESFLNSAAVAAVDGSEFVSSRITEHLDEPELLQEKMAQADLVRQFFGNPFQEPRIRIMSAD
jgi:hypothetical protein